MIMKRTIVGGFVFIFVCGAVYGFLRFPELVNRFRSQKSINVLVWPNVIDASFFHEFENETGITVHLSYFENYEELLVKMQSGTSDYDLVMASDYAVKFLIHAQVVKPLDKKKCPVFDRLYPSLLGSYVDPENTYAIPYSWEMYGIGIDTDYFKGSEPQASWSLLFDEKLSPPLVGMLDDGREIVSIAALYLFGKKNQTVTDDQMNQIERLLQKQKKRVAMYTDLRTDYLLVSKTAPVVLGISSDIYHAMRTYDNIQFLVPQEGSFMLVDMWLIPQQTKKDEWVYQFLSFLYRPDIVKKYADRFNFFPALQGVAADRYMLTPAQTVFSRLRFFNYDIPEQQLRNLWISLKS